MTGCAGEPCECVVLESVPYRAAREFGSGTEAPGEKGVLLRLDVR